MADVNWSLFDARVLVNGNTSKDRQINNYKNTLTRYKVNSLSYKDIEIDGVAENLFITDTKDPYVKNFQDVDEVITSAGTIIEYVGEHWLVEKLSFDGELYKTGNLRYCNYNLKFLSSTLQPTSRYCYVTRTRSGTDINGNPVQIELGNGRLSITLPYDSETSILDRTYPDGRTQRLLVDFGSTTPRAYEIKDANRLLPGCVVLELEECQRSKDDSVANMIADYDRYLAIPTTVIPTEGKCQIIFTGDAVLSCGLAPKKFSPKFISPTGEVINSTPVWSVSMTNSALESKVLVTRDGKDIYLQVTDVSIIGETVTLTLTDDTATVITTLSLEVKSIG